MFLLVICLLVSFFVVFSLSCLLHCTCCTRMLKSSFDLFFGLCRCCVALLFARVSFVFLTFLMLSLFLLMFSLLFSDGQHLHLPQVLPIAGTRREHPLRDGERCTPTGEKRVRTWEEETEKK